MKHGNGNVIVVGASMAGLLAARVLSESFGHVTVLDRDTWTREPEPRGGVPHSRHPHGLLARGREVLEQLFPGLTDELTSAGGVPGDLQADFRWHFGGVALAQAPSGLRGLAVSRPLLETAVRRRVAQLPNVDIRQDQAVVALRSDRTGQRVAGLTVDRRSEGMAHLPADLVVDASGRTSCAPRWLAGLGYPAPPEERVRIDLAYATRSFRRRSAAPGARLGMSFAASPDRPFSGIVIAQEDDRWIMSLGGRHGDRAPVELGIARLQASAAYDPDLAGDFLRVVNLKEAPASLLAPGRVVRTMLGARTDPPEGPLGVPAAPPRMTGSGAVDR